jgi:hypothetical protein
MEFLTLYDELHESLDGMSIYDNLWHKRPGRNNI